MSGRRPEAPRGTRDVLPAEHRTRDHVVATAADVFRLHGYGHITTPTFEHTEVFARGVGASTDIVRKEMYTFDDRGGRSITLRPEGTAGVVRAFVEHGMHKLPLPAKLWYTGPMFRYEAPQAGRFREHTQLGVEAIGSDDPLLDVEVISMLAMLYERLRVPGVRLRVGTLGDREGREPYKRHLRSFLAPSLGELPSDAKQRLEDNPLRLFDSKDAVVQRWLLDAPRLVDHLSQEARERHHAVLSGLKALGIAFERDDTLVRGLDYYTHTVFEFTCDRLGAQSGIGGGGRYDGLVEQLGGPSAPGIGFGTGIERIVLALEAGDLAPEAPGVDLYFAVLGDAARRELFPMLSRLRARGLSCEFDFAGRGLKGMMRHASGLGARRVVIVGDRERENGVAVVRDMAGGEQHEVPLSDLEAHL